MGKLQIIDLKNGESIVQFKHSYGKDINAWFEDAEDGHIFKVNNHIVSTPKGTVSLMIIFRGWMGKFFSILKKQPYNSADTSHIPIHIQQAIYKEAIGYARENAIVQLSKPIKGYRNERFSAIELIAFNENTSIFLDLEAN